MNIVFIQKSTGRGGAKNSLAESLAAMAEDSSIRASVVVGEQGSFTERCQTIGVPFRVSPLPEWRKFLDRLRFPSAMKRLSKDFESEKIDWVISNEMWWAPHASTLARHLGCRSAVILRDGIATIPKSHQYRLADNDLILPVSSTIGNALTLDPSFAPKVKLLFNAVSVPLNGRAPSSQLDETLRAFPKVKRWLLILGKVGERKNQADGVRLLRLLLDDGRDDLGLLIAGDIDPSYAAEMERIISANAVGDRVAMLGNFDDIRSLLERTDTVLLTSYREGLPRSLVESITAGKPAFAYPCEGVEDIYGPHLRTFVSENSTPPAFHQTIREAWENPVQTAAAFEEVRSHVLARFSPAAHLERMKSLLTSPDRTPFR